MTGRTAIPLVVEAVNHLKVRSCLIDGEVVCCDERGVAVFHVLRHRRNEPQAFLYAFDLLELDGADMRREPIEVRKATLASILRKSRHGVRLNEHLEHPEGDVVFRHACKMGLEGIVSNQLAIFSAGITRPISRNTCSQTAGVDSCFKTSALEPASAASRSGGRI